MSETPWLCRNCGATRAQHSQLGLYCPMSTWSKFESVEPTTTNAYGPSQQHRVVHGSFDHTTRCNAGGCHD
jgi:hypothetical protein